MKLLRKVCSLVLVLAMLSGMFVPAAAAGTKTIQSVEIQEVKMIPILHTTTVQNGIMTTEAFDVLQDKDTLAPRVATVHYTDGTSFTGTLAEVEAETGGTFQHVNPVHTTSAYMPGSTYQWPMKLVVGSNEYTFDCPITVLQVVSFTVDPVTMVETADQRTITYDDGTSKQCYDVAIKDPHVYLTFQDGSTHTVRWNKMSQGDYLWHMGYSDELGATTENWGVGTHTIKAGVYWHTNGAIQSLATADVTVEIVPNAGVGGGTLTYGTDLTGQMIPSGSSLSYTFAPDSSTWLLEFTPDNPQILHDFSALELVTDMRGGDWYVRNDKLYRVVQADAYNQPLTVTLSNHSHSTVTGTMAVRKPTPIDGITFMMGDSWTDFVGQYYGLQVNPTTQLATDITYTFTTDNPSAAVFEVNGTDYTSVTETAANHSYALIRARAPGSAKITVTATDSRGGSVTKTFSVTIKEISGSFTLGETKNITLQPGEHLGYEFVPQTTGGYVFSGYRQGGAWFCLDAIPNEDYDVPDSNSTLHMSESSELSAGRQYMLEVMNDGSTTETISITLSTMEFMGLTIETPSRDLKIGNTTQATVGPYPRNTQFPAGGTFTWYTTNPAVATVAADANDPTTATVTAVSEGSTQVVCKYTYTDSTGSPIFKEVQYTANVIPDTDGDFHSGNSHYIQLDPGEELKFAVHPDGDGKHAFWWEAENGEPEVHMNNGVQIWQEMRNGLAFRKVELNNQQTYTITFANTTAEPMEMEVFFHFMPAPDRFHFENVQTEMFAGSDHRIWIGFDPFFIDLDGITWSVSDDTVISLSGQGPERTLTALKAGTATVTATHPSGATAECTVTVLPDPADTAVWQGTVNGNPGEEQVLQVTVTEPGEYWLKTPHNIPADSFYIQNCEEPTRPLFDFEDDYFRGLVVHLEPGTHTFTGFTHDQVTFNAYLDKVTVLTAADLQVVPTTITGLEIGDYQQLRAEPINAVSNGVYHIDIKSNNNDVVLPLGIGSTFATVAAVSVGSATVSMFDQNGHLIGSTKITTAAQPGDLHLMVHDECVLGVGPAGLQYKFMPEETRAYYIGFAHWTENRIQVTVTDSNGNSVSGTDFNMDDRIGAFYDLTKNESYTITLTSAVPTTSNIRIDWAEKATDFTLLANVIPGCMEGQLIEIPMELQNGNVAELTVTSNDTAVAVPAYVSNNAVYVKIVGGGEAVITVKLGTTEYTCGIIATAIPAELKLQANTPKDVTLLPGENAFYFTPEESGAYWIYRPENLPEGQDIWGRPWINANHGEMGNEYQFNNGENYGYVFNLNAGETYMYVIDSNAANSTTIGVQKVVEPTGITPEATTYTGMVGETVSCLFDLTPAGSVTDMLEPTSSDPSVAEVEAWSGHCVNVYLKGEGTATITVKTANGLSQTFTVTAEAMPELELGEQHEIAYNGNNHRFVQFTPTESGYYRFFIDCVFDAWLGVLDSDENFVCEPKSFYYMKLETYYVVYLNAGETYLLATNLEDGNASETGKLWVEKAVVPTAFEITKLPNKTEGYIAGYIEYGIDFEGLEFQVTWSDGSSETYTLEMLEELNGWVKGFEPLMELEETEGSATVSIKIGDAFDSFEVTTVENPVESIEILDPLGLKIPENTHMIPFIEESGMYADFLLWEVLQMKVNYTDGTSKTFDLVSGMVDGYTFEENMRELQEEAYFEHGILWGADTYPITFSYLGAEATYNLQIVENTVESIEVLTIPSEQYVFGNEAYGIYDSVYGWYTFVPANYDLYKGLSFRINYTDGTSEVVFAEDFDWPCGTEYHRGRFGYYKGLPVETYKDSLCYGDYWHGANFKGPGQLEMTICYAGKADTYTLELLAAHVHEPVHHDAKAPTCTEDGHIEHWTCTGCDLIFSDAALEHEIVSPVDPATGHDPVHHDAKAPTCTEDGQIEHWICNNCDLIYSDAECEHEIVSPVDPATGHTEVIDAAEEATCTATGLTEGKHCSVCNEVLVAQTVVPVKDHTEVIDAAVEATCTATGLTEGKHCSVCNEVLVAQTVVPVKDHTYESNLTGPGEVTETCSCGDSKTTYTAGWSWYNNAWYYRNADNTLATGWLQLGSTWYFFNADGTMVTGWQQLGYTWYYFNAGGDMATGWLQLGDTWYYLQDSGAMVTGTVAIGGVQHSFNDGGVWLGEVQSKSGWVQENGYWYYYNTDGSMATDWLLLGNTWYYLHADGTMATGIVTIGGAQHSFNDGGAWLGQVQVKTGWQWENGYWYYYNADGSTATGWLLLGNTWYFFNADGTMVTGWQQLGYTWYYFNAGGDMVTGWLQLGSTWYYFISGGAMVTGTQVLDGNTYHFSDSGAWIP